MADAKKDKIPEIPEWPEETWLALAISAAFILLVLVVLGAIWMFQAFPDAEAMGARSRVLTPIGAAGLAVVTFCTVVWRGLVTTRQANEQIRTNNQKDEELLAKLLLDGTNCLHDKKEITKLAGIAALSATVMSPNKRYAVPAMNILAQFISSDDHRLHEADAWNAAIRAVKQGGNAGHRASSFIKLTAPEDSRGTTPWPAINGTGVIYSGGIITGSAYPNFEDIDIHAFMNVTFKRCRVVKVPRGVFNCIFSHCRFERYSTVRKQRFSLDACDFSGATIDDNVQLGEDRLHELRKCFYYADDPPIIINPKHDWSRILGKKDPIKRPKVGSVFYSQLYGTA